MSILSLFFLKEGLFLVLHMVCIILTFAYAFCGTYVHNQPANIWSIIWSKGVGLVQMIVEIISIILGIGGIVTSKGNTVQLAFAVALLASLLLGMLSMIYAIGSHF